MYVNFHLIATDMCTDDDCKGEKEEFCTIDNGSYHCNCKKGYRIKISCEGSTLYN